MKSKKTALSATDTLRCAHTKADWETQAKKELRAGRTLEDLMWKYVPEIPLEPFFNHESLTKPLAQIPSLAASKQYTTDARTWGHVLYVTLEQLKDTEHYATFCKEHEIHELLIDVGTDTQYIKPHILQKVQLLNLDVSYRCEMQHSTFYKTCSSCPKFVWEIEIPVQNQCAQGACIDLTFMESQGLSLVWQLAYVLSRADAWLRDTEHAVPWTIINVATTDYYHEIAKLRAMRLLLDKIWTLHNKSWALNQLRILGVPGLPRATHLAPTMNLVRYTTDIMAMLLGGITDLLILPHGCGLSPRLTANISHVFAYEAHIAQAREAATGTYFLDYLTHRLSEEAWHIYTIWKEKGGVEGAEVREELKKACVKASADQKMALATGTRTMIGVNQYVFIEKQLATLPTSSQKTGFYLDTPRVSEEYEALYTQGLNFWKKYSPPLLHLVGEGSSAQAREAHLHSRDGWALIGIEGPSLLIDPHAPLPEKPFIWHLCLDEQINAAALQQLLDTVASKTHYTLWVCGRPQEAPQMLRHTSKIIYLSYQAPPLENWRTMQTQICSEVQHT